MANETLQVTQLWLIEEDLTDDFKTARPKASQTYDSCLSQQRLIKTWYKQRDRNEQKCFGRFN